MKRPYTLEQEKIERIPDTTHRSKYFFHIDHKRDGETNNSIAIEHGIDPSTGRRWRQEVCELGNERRVRKEKAEQNNQKLGRPFWVCQEKLQELLDDPNIVRDKPLTVQAYVHDRPLKKRALEYNFSERFDAHMYLQAYTQEVRNKRSKRQRINYGEEHKDKPIFGFWDGIFFTDEAHYNPTVDFQKPSQVGASTLSPSG
jgi:hypothetical protein